MPAHRGPVTLALPGVEREREVPAAAGMERLPVDRAALHIQGAQAVQQRLVIRHAAAQRAEGNTGGAEGLAQRLEQDRMRPDLEEARIALAQSGDRLAEEDRPRHVAAPVVRAERPGATAHPVTVE